MDWINIYYWNDNNEHPIFYNNFSTILFTYVQNMFTYVQNIFTYVQILLNCNFKYIATYSEWVSHSDNTMSRDETMSAVGSYNVFFIFVSN